MVTWRHSNVVFKQPRPVFQIVYVFYNWVEAYWCNHFPYPHTLLLCRSVELHLVHWTIFNAMSYVAKAPLGSPFCSTTQRISFVCNFVCSYRTFDINQVVFTNDVHQHFGWDKNGHNYFETTQKKMMEWRVWEPKF